MTKSAIVLGSVCRLFVLLPEDGAKSGLLVTVPAEVLGVVTWPPSGGILTFSSKFSKVLCEVK